jgi:Ca-activated chloride channel family protein
MNTSKAEREAYRKQGIYIFDSYVDAAVEAHRLGLISREGVNHLILLTDGRTYGDEETCLRIAEAAAEKGITLNGVGIGADWSDRLLDDLASRSGGNVLFLDTPKAVTDLLQRIFDSLGKVFASRVRLEGAFSDEVDLRSTFRLYPIRCRWATPCR